MVATVPEMRATSMAEPVLSTAVLLTAALIQKVIGLKGDEAPTAAKVSARYQLVTSLSDEESLGTTLRRQALLSGGLGHPSGPTRL